MMDEARKLLEKIRDEIKRDGIDASQPIPPFTESKPDSQPDHTAEYWLCPKCGADGRYVEMKHMILIDYLQCPECRHEIALVDLITGEAALNP